MILHWLLHVLGVLIGSTLPILHRYGLPAVFVILLAENAGVIFAPGESVLVAAGFLTAKGVLSLWSAPLVAILAAALGGYLSYGLGVYFGHEALLKYGPKIGIRPGLVDRGHRFFQRFGVGVLLFGRFLVPLRQLQGYLAGSSQMSFVLFAVGNGAGAVLWVGTWGSAAFLLARLIPIPG